MGLCTRCLTSVQADKADELGRCPRCTAEQAVIEAARAVLVALLWCPDPDCGRSVPTARVAEFAALRAAIANLDAGGGRGE